jgi:hypothetical protein
MKNVVVRFERNDSHEQGEGQSKLYGPYEWFQMTYGTLCAGENGEIIIANRTEDGLWETEEDNTWSDFIISAEEQP